MCLTRRDLLIETNNLLKALWDAMKQGRTITQTVVYLKVEENLLNPLLNQIVSVKQTTDPGEYIHIAISRAHF